MVRQMAQRFVCISGWMKTPEASDVNIGIPGRRTKRVLLRCYVAGESRDGELALQSRIRIGSSLPVTCRKIASNDVKRQTRFPSIDKNRVRHEIWTVVFLFLG